MKPIMHLRVLLYFLHGKYFGILYLSIAQRKTALITILALLLGNVPFLPDYILVTRVISLHHPVLVLSLHVQPIVTEA